MEKIWLSSYPSDVPPEVDINRYQSINDLVSNASRRFRTRPAFRNFKTTISYSDIERLSRDFAAFLQNAPGLERGARIAIMMPNLIQYPVVLFGALRAGMTVVNVNPLYTSRELQHQLKDSGAKAIVILENFAHVLEAVLTTTDIRLVITTQVGDCLHGAEHWVTNFVVKRVKKMVPPWSIPEAIPLRRALAHGGASKWTDPLTGPDDLAFLQYTGGTTGVSKGAMLTHRNIIANVLQAAAWTAPALEEGTETLITALPLYHIFALTVNCLLCMEIGGLNILITNPRDVAGLVKLLKTTPFTVFVGVNTLFNGLLHTPGFSDIDFSGMKFALGGGAAVQATVAAAWEEVTKRPLVQGYGLTEASPIVCCNRFDEDFNGTIGPPIPSTAVKIVGNDDREVGIGRDGEICVRGPQVMRGYWKQPSETEKVLGPSGWLHTGDIGAFDMRGFVRITDRKKDMILVSGFNVFPNEVESVLATHPGIAECAVVGAPDPITGEAVKAFIVKKDPNLTPEAIIAFCRKSLTGYKVPKKIEFRPSLPKNPIGKVLRRELRPEVELESSREATANGG